MHDETTKQNDIVEIIECKTAKQFVETLRRSNKLFARGHKSPFIFRGHQDASYDLIPSLYRPDVCSSNAYSHWYSHYREYPDTLQSSLSTRQQKCEVHSKVLVRVEDRLLTDFAIKANRIGLFVPELEKAVRGNDHVDIHTCNIEKAKFYITGKITSKRHLPLYAGLAQHHGVKTRLLDFTYNPQKAIFFAIKNYNSKTNDDDKDICVWAFPLEVFEDNWFDGLSLEAEEDDEGHIFSRYSSMIMATSMNDYLYRQEGLFLYPMFPHEYMYKFSKYPSVLDFLQYANRQPFPRLKVYKVLIPARYSYEVQRLLTLEGITLASLMPTFDNVRMEMDHLPWTS